MQFSSTHFIIDIQGSLLNPIVGDGKSWLKGFMEDADSLANDHYGEACQVSLP